MLCYREFTPVARSAFAVLGWRAEEADTVLVEFGRPRPTAAPPAVVRRARPWRLLHGDSHAVTHQHLSAVGADHAKDDVELKAGGTRRGRHSLEMRCTRSAC
jgi:hypothetical protein